MESWQSGNATVLKTDDKNFVRGFDSLTLRYEKKNTLDTSKEMIVRNAEAVARKYFMEGWIAAHQSPDSVCPYLISFKKGPWEAGHKAQKNNNFANAYSAFHVYWTLGT